LLGRKALRFSTVERKVKAFKGLMVHVSDLVDVDCIPTSDDSFCKFEKCERLY